MAHLSPCGALWRAYCPAGRTKVSDGPRFQGDRLVKALVEILICVGLVAAELLVAPRAVLRSFGRTLRRSHAEVRHAGLQARRWLRELTRRTGADLGGGQVA